MIHWVQEVDSTNRWAAEEAEKGAAHGSLYVAIHQTAGRGRQERSWQSSEQGLTMTLLLRPDQPAHVLGRMPFLAAMAVCDAVKEYGLHARIKWPNDIVVDGKKLCGILCESRLSGATIEWCILGVGINLLQRQEDFTQSHQQTATSLYMQTGKQIERQAVIDAFLAQIDLWYQPCLQGTGAFWQGYRERSATLGSFVRVVEPLGEWTGQAVEIQPDGALVVENDGKRRVVYAGDVSVRGMMGYV